MGSGPRTRTFGRNTHASSGGHAGIAVRHAIAATDRRKDFRAKLGHLATDATLVSKSTGITKVAVEIGATGDSGDSTAHLTLKSRAGRIQ